jgi:hypothetical protein
MMSAYRVENVVSGGEPCVNESKTVHVDIIGVPYSQRYVGPGGSQRAWRMMRAKLSRWCICKYLVMAGVVSPLDDHNPDDG